MKKIQPFHLAVPVDDLEKAREFYRNVLLCREGRSSDHWVDFDFFGHQLVLHYKKGPQKVNFSGSNPVDGKEVPVPHFGVVLEWEQFEEFSRYLEGKVSFVIKPYIRFKGKPGEQATMFFRDPCGNALEFKAFKNIDQLFAH